MQTTEWNAPPANSNFSLRIPSYCTNNFKENAPHVNKKN